MALGINAATNYTQLQLSSLSMCLLVTIVTALSPTDSNNEIPPMIEANTSVPWK